MASPSFWFNPGTWIAVLSGLMMALNALRAFRSPVAFASYFGLPLANDAGHGLVRAYGLRALFIAILLVILLAEEDGRLLGIVVLSAAIMPLGDAILTRSAGAGRLTIARHVIIMLLLVIAGISLVFA